MSTQTKYSQSETVVIKRSQINFAPYNPKRHSKEAINLQKRNIKRVGILGGIVWNATTGNLVSGHKRMMAMDELNAYDGTAETNYDVKVEKVALDEKTEKEQNIFMDAPSANTPQELDLLAVIIPAIDYKNAGLNLEDLQIIGIDEVFKTETEQILSGELDHIKRAGQVEKQELSYEEKKQQTKEAKQQILDDAHRKAENMEAYVMLSFDSYQHKAEFMQRFGFDQRDKYIKGELFDEMIERTN